MHQLSREKKRGVLVSQRRITSADLTAAATSQSFDLPDIPAGALILGGGVEVVTAFDDGATGVFTGDVGESGGDTDAILDGVDLETVGHQGGPLGVLPSSYVGAYTPALLVDAGAVNVNTAIQGELVAKVFYSLGG